MKIEDPFYGRGDTELTLEEMIAKKKELRLTNEMIASLSGVPIGTVQKIFSGETKAPRKLTIDALVRALEHSSNSWKGSIELHESALPYHFERKYPDADGEDRIESRIPGVHKNKERKYTIADYYALPEDRRAELIDGVIYDMTAPSTIHQLILGDLYAKFRECIEAHDMPCDVYLSPCDVRLDRDNYTMVQPDLLVVCAEDDGYYERVEGAPDLVVEILSPSTRRKDMVLKLYKYQNAGVREYWIIDPLHQRVYVHYFEKEDYAPEQYGLDAVIPVGISGGKCSIDFSGVGVSRRRKKALQADRD